MKNEKQTVKKKNSKFASPSFTMDRTQAIMAGTLLSGWATGFSPIGGMR